jgi:hypothetical protein
MTVRVIRSIQFDEQALRSGPAFLENVGPGLLVTLDAEQRLDAEGKPSLPVELGSMVRVRRPDGTLTACVVAAVEVWGPHVGLYFPRTEQHEIPISSEIELPG